MKVEMLSLAYQSFFSLVNAKLTKLMLVKFSFSIIIIQ